MKIKRADIERILILCAAALVVVLALRSNDQTTSQVLVEQTAIPIEQTIAQEDTVATVVFYEDGDGYLVPVTRQVPKTDGIAKATLALMVKDAENDMQAARLGLRTVIPEGTTFDIDISDGRLGLACMHEDPLFRLAAPRMSVARFPVEEISAHAVRLLLRQIRESQSPGSVRPAPESVVLPCRMEFRDE